MNTYLKSIDRLLTTVLIVFFILLFSLCAFFVWDNLQVYKDAENVMTNISQLKPTDKGEDGKLSFEQLRAVNPDVCAWLTVYGTHIYYPILQSKDNIYYINRDIYKNFSMSGSIFLDSRNSPLFDDNYSLVYGHHMDKHQMFGDLDSFLDEDFFNENRTAEITTEDGKSQLTVLSVMKVIDSDRKLFDPTVWDSYDLADLVLYLKDNSVLVYEPAMGVLEIDPTMYKLVVLVTCSSGHTGERTVLVLMQPKDDNKSDNDTPENNNQDKPTLPQTGDTIVNSYVFWIVILIAGAAITVIGVGCYRIKEAENEPKNEE